MGLSGYWIECLPCDAVAEECQENSLYTASIDVFPDIVIRASSPDAAIDRMRWKLLALRRDYAQTGKLLPRSHSPHHPPIRNRTIQGWLSVYIEVES